MQIPQRRDLELREHLLAPTASQGFRAATTRGWFGLDPAYYYNGNRGRRSDGPEINIPVADQFATELDDFADCIINKQPTEGVGRDGRVRREVPDGDLRIDQEGPPRHLGKWGHSSIS